MERRCDDEREGLTRARACFIAAQFEREGGDRELRQAIASDTAGAVRGVGGFERKEVGVGEENRGRARAERVGEATDVERYHE
jgi:hypothetical protein